MRSHHATAAIVLSTLLASRAHAADTGNGSNLNGSNLNGSNLNGSNLNGPSLAETLVHVKLAGARVVGAPPSAGVRLDGTVFRARSGDATWSGEEFQGARFAGVKGDGNTVELRISAVHPGAGDASGVWSYEVLYLDPEAGWSPICKDADGPSQAIPVSGRWDYRAGHATGGAKTDDASVFTFACRGTSAIAKCVDLGYAPWRSSTIADHHQACTRLLRADFCGDGTSHTTEGERVNLYDDIGIQKDTENWIFESEWDAGGAQCFSPLNRSHEGVPCFDHLVTDDCGTFETGTLLMNETPSGGLQ